MSFSDAVSHTLIIGCGYVGQHLAQRLLAAGQEVSALKRAPQGVPEGCGVLLADVTQPESLAVIPESVNQVVYAVSAGGRTEARYRAAYEVGVRNVLAHFAQKQQALRRLVFVSSSAVYAENSGGVVDEASLMQTGECFAAASLLAGERAVQTSEYPATVVRFSGIYGVARQRRLREMLSELRAGEPIAVPSDGVVNHIHVEDCAGVLAHVLGLPEEGLKKCYLASDSEPCSSEEMYRWLAQHQGLPLPHFVASGASGSAYRAAKRCNNARLLASGYEFRYPSFRQGYEELL